MARAPKDDKSRDGQAETAAGLVALAAFVLALAPFAFGWASSGIASAFRHFAADAFYYLTIAKNAAPFPVFTFDGEFPTNGFHPLWMIFLRYLFPAVGAEDQAAQITLVYWIGAFFLALASAILARVACRLTGRPAIALLAVVPGLLYPAVALVEPTFGAVWSFANGMESSASLLLFAVLLAFLTRGDAYSSARRLIVVSILATLVVLARLDDVFLLAGLAAPVVLSGAPRGVIVRRLAMLWAIPAATLAAYLAVNLVVVGAALPVSGAMKSGFELLGNLRAVVNLVAPLDPILEGDWSWWRISGGRAVMIALPATVSLAYGVWIMRTRRELSSNEKALLALAAYVVLKALYNLAFVRLAHQGYWYFPISIMAANLQLAALIAGRREDASQRRAGAPFLAAALAALFAAVAFTAAQETAEDSAREEAFWTRRDVVMRDLSAIDPAMKVLSFDDGVVAYALDLPVMSGFGFALDPAAARAAAEGRLLETAHARGFRYVASVNNFPDLLGVEIGADVTARLAEGRWIAMEEARRWRLTLAYVNSDAQFKLMRLAPAP